jgi:COMPASS component BRE2
MNVQVHANKAGNTISTSKGWRMARANVGVREGEWYYECKILQGIADGEEHAGHVRIGWARREGSVVLYSISTVSKLLLTIKSSP